MQPKEIIQKIIFYAGKYNLPPEVVYGVCRQESMFDPSACRYESHYKWLLKPDRQRPRNCSAPTETTFQKTSIGLMQVMGAVYRELGYSGWLSALFNDIDAQLDYGCKYLSHKIRKYGREEGILAYNAGSPRKDSDGNYVNAYYLERVMTGAAEFNKTLERIYEETH